MLTSSQLLLCEHISTPNFISRANNSIIIIITCKIVYNVDMTWCGSLHVITGVLLSKHIKINLFDFQLFASMKERKYIQKFCQSILFVYLLLENECALLCVNNILSDMCRKNMNDLTFFFVIQIKIPLIEIRKNTESFCCLGI